MTHIHKRSGLAFEIGTMDDTDGIHTYDITVITKWDNEEDCIGSGVEIVGFYFGEYDKDITDDYIDQFLERRQRDYSLLNKAIKTFNDYLVTNMDVLEDYEIRNLRHSIRDAHSMLVDLIH